MQAVLEKAEAKQVQETGVEMFRVQEQLGRLQNILDECNQAKAQAEAKHQQAGDQLEVTKFHFSNLTTRDSSAKASGEAHTLLEEFIFMIPDLQR